MLNAPGWFSLAAVGVLWSCTAARNDNAAPSSTTPTSQVMTIVAGDAQSAVAGQAVATPPSVKVATSGGSPVSGVAITFAGATGSIVTGVSATTNVAGIATVGSWTLSQTAGPNSLTASAGGAVTGSPITFSATGIAGPPAAMVKLLGDLQQAPAGQNVAVAPAVGVRDQFGNVAAGSLVRFAVGSGGGSVVGETQSTAATGTATVGSWRLGNVAGPNTLTATASASGVSGSPLTFSASGLVGAPALMSKIAGDNQTAVAGTAVAVAPTVRVTDIVGNNVNGAGVNFVAATGGGSVTAAAQVTAADGTAKPGGWTLGATAGSNTVTATTAATPVTGSPLTFTATGTPGLNAAAYAGNWSGTWTNTTFGSTGTTALVIAVGASANQVTIMHSGTGTVLGGSGAPVETRSNVPYTASAFTLQTVSTTFGNVVLNVDANGNVVGSGTQVPNAAISRWDCTGTITTTQVRLNFTVTFAGGGTAVGTIAINKQ